jgi:hypothetical protein
MDIPKAVERELYKALDALVAWMDAKTGKRLSDEHLAESKVDFCTFREELVEQIADLFEYRNTCEENKARNVDTCYMVRLLATAKHLRGVDTEKREAPIEGEDGAPFCLTLPSVI